MNRRRLPHATRVLVVACLLTAIRGSAVVGQRSLGDLTGPWQLFVDDWLVESKSNLTRVHHPFEKYAGNPVLTPTQPWEDSIVYIYGTVLPAETGAGYRMWYHTLRPEDPADDGSNVLYATSPDGIHWHKPNLHINAWHGSTANNMIFDRPTRSGIASVIHTPWDPDPGRQYRLFNYEGTYYGAVSPDGIHTTDLPGNPIISGVGDVAMASWDPHTQRYLAYVKVNTDVNGLRRRSVALCTSTDFQTWTEPLVVLEPDSFDDRWVLPGTLQRTHFYGLCAFAYETMYVGILWIFRATDAEGYTIGPVYAEIVTSRDGVHWTREEGNRPAMLPLGPSGTWDDGQLYTAIAPVYREGKLAIYYGACDDVHGTATKRLNCNIGLATLRKDGFASLTAGTNTGWVMTRPLDGLTGQLHVNYQAAGGWLKVEVLDANYAVIPGYGEADCIPLTGDSIDEVVAWNGGSELPASSGPLRLRFILRNASIYSFMTATPVYEPPTIVSQPADQSVTPGKSVTFVIQAAGTPPMRYQWRRNGMALVDGGRYAGTTTASLQIHSVDTTCVGQYDCVVSNPYGSATSAAANLGLAAMQFQGLASGTTVTGISADGTVVCGTTAANRAFIWTRTEGFREIGVPAGATQSKAAGVGWYNGNVVVAVNCNASSFTARRWEGNTAGVGTFASLPKLNGALEWVATGLGSSGTDYWISGLAPTGGAGGGRKAGRYTRSTNTTASYTLPPHGHDNSDFHAVSDNGRCGGQYQYKGQAPTGGARNAMIYVGGTQCVALNTLLGGPNTIYEAVVRAMSRDGTAQGGWSYYAGGGAWQQPVVWKDSLTPTAVPFIPGGDGDNWGEILALNGDGTVAGGYSCRKNTGVPDGPREALIWDAAYGTRQYQGLLTSEYGLDLAGWSLQEIRGMSADATTVIGNGTYDGQTRAWIVSAVTPPRPAIEMQPISQRVCPGSTVTFNIEPAGAGPFTYEWHVNGTKIFDGDDVTGATTPTLTISRVGASHVGEYRCAVTTLGGGTVSEPAVLSLRPSGPSDLDGDCDVDLDDLTILVACATGPGVTSGPPTGCSPEHFSATDLDGDGDVDQTDFGWFQRCYTGPGADIEPSCAE
ncbi:MAG TPA: immunoglobulin domain-containing protein [Phycisphaerae bacterium]|nr:immunoglobulin domain-containing protein [Phycisphaerae bacterium]